MGKISMSKDAYYFSHDSNARNDQRIMKIRMKYGMEGYGIYFGIIEILREQEDYTLTFDDLESISFDLRVDIEKIEDIVSNYNLFVIEGMSSFYSKSLTRRMEKLDLIKEKRADAGRIGGKSKANANQMPSKESKVKDNKIKEIKENNIDIRCNSFFNDLKQFESEFGEDNINDFGKYWTEPNKSNTKMKFEMQPTWDTKRRIQRWIGNDFGSNKTNGVSKFKLDTTGNAYIAYCIKCSKSDFYGKEELNGDSKCHNAKLLSEKPDVKV
tara:strand:+ start:1210 stop:2016 length:807 start_codon:yes stop_codon:yes gene_type:complete